MAKHFSENMLKEMWEFMVDQLMRMDRATYHSFIDSFKYSLRKHLNSISAYRQNLSKNAYADEKIELVLLIEIHTEMGYLF